MTIVVIGIFIPAHFGAVYARPGRGFNSVIRIEKGHFPNQLRESKFINNPGLVQIG